MDASAGKAVQAVVYDSSLQAGEPDTYFDKSILHFLVQLLHQCLSLLTAKDRRRCLRFPGKMSSLVYMEILHGGVPVLEVLALKVHAIWSPLGSDSIFWILDRSVARCRASSRQMQGSEKAMLLERQTAACGRALFDADAGQ